MSKSRNSLRKKLIRLAHSKPELRKDILPLLVGVTDKVAAKNYYPEGMKWYKAKLDTSTLAGAQGVQFTYLTKQMSFSKYVAHRMPNHPGMWALTRGYKFNERNFRNINDAALLKLFNKVQGFPGGTGGIGPTDWTHTKGEAYITKDHYWGKTASSEHSLRNRHHKSAGGDPQSRSTWTLDPQEAGFVTDQFGYVGETYRWSGDAGGKPVQFTIELGPRGKGELIVSWSNRKWRSTFSSRMEGRGGLLEWASVVVDYLKQNVPPSYLEVRGKPSFKKI